MSYFFGNYNYSSSTVVSLLVSYASYSHYNFYSYR